MLKSMRKLVIMPLLCVILAVTIQSANVKAASVCMIKVPLGAKVYVGGVLQEESKRVSSMAKEGRIHEIAFSVLGIPYGYDQYMIANVTTPDTIIVYDAAMNQLTVTNAEIGLLDYTGASADFATQVSQRVQDAAIAYANRVAGRSGNGNLSNYFQAGSDAYNKVVASDAGRKYGLFVNPKGVQTIIVSDICPYNADAFTAKASVTSTEVNGYQESYDLSMLFQNNGKGWYVTKFTLMK